MHSKIDHRIPTVGHDLCIGCGTCTAVCPTDPIVFELSEEEPGQEKSYVVNPDLCIDCGACIDACPAEAINMIEP